MEYLMDIQHYQAVRAALPGGRSLYTYYKDRYSLQLLRYAVRDITPVSRLRAHPVARLLEKPRVKTLLSACGTALSPALIAVTDGDPAAQHYSLSVGCWGAAPGEQQQMSRRGTNLVLQLNFSQAHNRLARRLLGLTGMHDPFNGCVHPVLDDPRSDRRYTLAWARLDIDPALGEALIEEIQSDWVRASKLMRAWAERPSGVPDWWRRSRGIHGASAALIEYDTAVLAPHRALWAEAMLSAALFFLREELGIARIWMHTPATSAHFKHMQRQAQPPRSLYTDLPERFCFQPTRSLPGFLAGDRKVQRHLRRQPDLQLQTLNF